VGAFAFVPVQLHATRTISWISVPIIACITTGAVFAIRNFGPECMRGVGDIGPRTDAEIARTGQLDDEVGPSKVFISVLWPVDGLADVFKDIYELTERKLIPQVPGLPAMYDYDFFSQTVCCI
jgi:hypothetical protein